MNSSFIIFPNKEKDTTHERWYKGRNIANLTHPCRVLVVSRPGGGKTTFVLNLILKQEPPFKRVYLMHPGLMEGDEESDSDDESQEPRVPEYDAIDYIPLRTIPEPKEFDASVKQLLVIDDMELRNSIKKEKHILNKLVSYASTHKNLSIIITSQCIFSQMLPAIGRFMNAFVVWHYDDANYMRMLAERIGIPKQKFHAWLSIMRSFGTHDSFMIDNTEGTPYPYRKNLCQSITL